MSSDVAQASFDKISASCTRVLWFDHWRTSRRSRVITNCDRVSAGIEVRVKITKAVQATPEEAAQAFVDCDAQVLLGIHRAGGGAPGRAAHAHARRDPPPRRRFRGRLDTQAGGNAALVKQLIRRSNVTRAFSVAKDLAAPLMEFLLTTRT